MKSNFVPTPQDSALIVETAVTQTATFNGASFDQGSGYAPGGCGTPVGAVVQVTALDLTSGNETYALKLQESDDNATWNDASPTVSVLATGTITVPGIVSRRYQRLQGTLGGTTPSITYSAWLNPNICS